jgi:hypothetical protein
MSSSPVPRRPFPLVLRGRLSKCCTSFPSLPCPVSPPLLPSFTLRRPKPDRLLSFSPSLFLLHPLSAAARAHARATGTGPASASPTARRSSRPLRFPSRTSSSKSSRRFFPPLAFTSLSIAISLFLLFAVSLCFASRPSSLPSYLSLFAIDWPSFTRSTCYLMSFIQLELAAVSSSKEGEEKNFLPCRRLAEPLSFKTNYNLRSYIQLE